MGIYRPEWAESLILVGANYRNDESATWMNRQLTADNIETGMPELAKFYGLLIAGENDPWANLDQMMAMRKSIPQSELLLINHAGHEVPQHHTPLVAAAIPDFLARHRR